MPRILPWHRAENKASVKKETTPRRVKTEGLRRDLTPKHLPTSPTKRDFFRSSQSPPSSPIKQCPPEEFLITGIEHDDGWVMVEDEFYAVAQTYTQHLHYAEYLRRRKEVKAKNATILGDIERPTDNRTPLPKEAERKREREALRQRQKAGLAYVEDGGVNEIDDDDDKLWAGTHLHGLMMSPRKTRTLVGSHSLKSSTRAAAGFKQAPASATTRPRVDSIGSVTSAMRSPGSEAIEINEETASDSDDDLDHQSQSAMQPPPQKAESTPRHHQLDLQTTPRAHRESNLRNNSTSKEKGKQPNGRPSPTPAFKSRVQSLFDDLDELPESSRMNNSIAKTKAPSASQPPETGRRNNLNHKKSRHNEVPTFLV